MSSTYLNEFKNKTDNKDFTKLMQLWEEYSNGDQVDAVEFQNILQLIRKSDLANSFGRYVETALPLWSKIEDQQASFAVLREILDLQTTNSKALGELATREIEKRYSKDENYKHKMRIIGLRNLDAFQGAIRNYELLSHMDVGQFVFHTSGWGTGEIEDISLIREHVLIEFENINGKRDLTFKNAFRTLEALDQSHFLARRFGDPEGLEEEAKRDPLAIIHLLLRDLGPKTSGEIKDELCPVVILKEDWSKWWQSAKTKIKKDTKIAVPSRVQNPFMLREEDVSHEEQFANELEGLTNVQKIIQTTYSYVRDFPSILKNAELKKSIQEKFIRLLEDEKVHLTQRVQLAVFLENQLGCKLEKHSLKEFVLSTDDFAALLNSIEILAFQKKVLVAARKFRDDWVELFSSIFHLVEQNPLRDYILKELEGPETVEVLKEILTDLLHHPEKNPNSSVWYFQKIISKEGLPFGDAEGRRQFLESLLILLQKLETKRISRDLRKKIYMILSAKRFAVVRSIIEGASVGYLKEFLLLVTKCQTLTDHDIKILSACAGAVQPSLAKANKKSKEEDHIIWTTEEGHAKLQELIKKTHSEVRENSKEVEAARALGDLRENFEFKAAKERQAQLQHELKNLADQANQVRVLSEKDISTETVGVGVKAEIVDSQGNSILYTILGPWDAIPEKYILSFQSERAKLMQDCAVGDVFTFRDEEYTVKSIKSFFEE